LATLVARVVAHLVAVAVGRFEILPAAAAGPEARLPVRAIVAHDFGPGHPRRGHGLDVALLAVRFGFGQGVTADVAIRREAAGLATGVERNTGSHAGALVAARADIAGALAVVVLGVAHLVVVEPVLGER